MVFAFGFQSQRAEMGCSPSKLDDVLDVPLARDIPPISTARSSIQIYRTPAEGMNPLIQSRVAEAPVKQTTTIQDLPPLLLSHIFAQHMSWEDLFGSIPLVCKSWHALAKDVTPHQLCFEFDLAEQPNSGSESKTSQTGVLQSLLNVPSQLLHRVASRWQRNEQQHINRATEDDNQQQLQQYLFLRNGPWATWLEHRGARLQDFSMSINNLDSSCAAAQCQLKEMLLRALADSTRASASLHGSSCSSRRSSLSGSSSVSSNSSSLDMLVLSTIGSHGSNNSSTPNTPKSTIAKSGFHFGDHSDASSSSSNAISTTSSAAVGLDSCCSSSSSLSSLSSLLQLKSLHLRVPLFEYDVLLLANEICSKSPQLSSLSLVGYSTGGAVHTRHSSSSSSAFSTSNIGGASSRGSRPPFGQPVRRRTSTVGAAPAVGGAAGNAARNHMPANSSGHEGAPANSGSRYSPPISSRGGFITGSSLKLLVASMPELESLTFACRQLYKLSWLAPATQLTYLSLRECSLGPELLKDLSKLPLTRLRGLDVSGNKGLGGPAADSSLGLLCKIAKGQLQQLDISGWDLSRCGGGNSRALPQLAALPQLTALRMECCGIKGWDLESGQLPGLTNLSLSGNPLDSRGVSAICSITQLRELELGHIAPKELMLGAPQRQQGQGPVCWSGMQAMPQLTSLSIPGNYWPDSSLPDRSPVVPFRAYKHSLCASLTAMPLLRLDLTDCKVPYKTLPMLLGSLPSTVTEVVLDGAVDGLRRGDLEALQQLPGLRVLSACRCNLRDKHAAVLSDLMGLQSLAVRENDLGPDGVADIMYGCTQLTELDIRGNKYKWSSSSPCTAIVRTVSRSNKLLLLHD